MGRFFRAIDGQKGALHTVKAKPGSFSKPPGSLKRIIYSSSYDDSFSVFFYACALQFCDVFFFYHKAFQYSLKNNNVIQGQIALLSAY